MSRSGAVRPRRYNTKFTEKINEAPKKTKESVKIRKLEVCDDNEIVDCQEGFEENDSDNTEEDSTEKQVDNLITFLKEREEIELDALLESFCEEKNAEHSDDIENENDVECDDDKDTGNDDSGDDQPIYPGHFLTTRTSVLLIWLVGMTYSFTSEQFSAVLTLLSLHMINCYPAMQSFYRFKRFFSKNESTFC